MAAHHGGALLEGDKLLPYIKKNMVSLRGAAWFRDVVISARQGHVPDMPHRHAKGLQTPALPFPNFFLK